jgi:hypothetical protein
MMTSIRPHPEAAVDTSRPPVSTMTETDPRENGMSLTQHPTDTDGSRTRPTRSRGERLAVIGGIVVTVLALAGIAFLLLGDDEQPDLRTSTPAAQASTEPTVEPVPQTPADVAAAQAQERYLEYVRIYDGVAAGGFTNLEPYRTVAIDPHLAELFLSARRLAGIRSTGSTEVASLAVQAVDLDPAGDYPSVRLLACLDVSRVTAVDASGQNAVQPDRLNRTRSVVTLRNIPAEAFNDGRPASWYVAQLEQPGEPC